MSILDVFEPIYKLLPEVKSPEVKPALKRRLMWSALALLLFFIMGNITVYGIDLSRSLGGNLAAFELILASKIGSLITVGIGPIVLASIILQMLVGGKIINIDLSNPKDRARFTSMQKLFGIVLCFFEAFVYSAFGFLVPDSGMLLPVILQIAFGAIILIYLDEVVSKYGIGSGIGLFIAGGVAGSIGWRIFAPYLVTNVGIVEGLLLQIVGEAVKGSLLNAFVLSVPIIFVIVIFLVVVFAEGMHVNIPITVGRSGATSRFPVKFLYVSNLPVILAMALYANLQMWAIAGANIPILGTMLGAVSYATAIPRVGGTALFEAIFLQGLSGIVIAEILHAVLYIAVFVVICVVFGKFWVEMAGQGPAAISEQLQKAGMSIPGFRKDPRIIRQILDRYIPPITILGSAFVALLAGLADLTGALGSGTGILLTVGIVYRLYEELAREQLMEMHPLLGRLFK
ncbi:MAG: preprotein translocase subunit SecY [Candidatus Diapherotrites archaeon]|nr:preprotein translocase subunit SecY [Candidatus Diapherotrites archaeon]